LILLKTDEFIDFLINYDIDHFRFVTNTSITRNCKIKFFIYIIFIAKISSHMSTKYTDMLNKIAQDKSQKIANQNKEDDFEMKKKKMKEMIEYVLENPTGKSRNNNLSNMDNLSNRDGSERSILIKPKVSNNFRRKKGIY
jgi:hypothetical protein